MDQVHRRRVRLECSENDAQCVRLDRFGDLIVQQPRNADTADRGFRRGLVVVTERRGTIGTSSGAVGPDADALNRQPNMSIGASRATHGRFCRSSGVRGTPRPANSAGLAHTTLRITPTCVVTIELSGSFPIRTAISR